MIKLKRGINLGNHYETGRGENFEHTMQPWYTKLINDLGFDHVRVPVRWSSYCDENMKINSDFAKVIKSAVDELLGAGLSVILNIHHFGGATEDPLGYESKILALWEQIANEYKDYPEKLVFEIMNEPTSKTDYESWNKVQSNAVKLIRKTNPTRAVMIGGIDYNGVYALNDLIPPENDDNIIATFHYYSPMEFTHQGARWNKNYVDLHNIPWLGTDEEIKSLKAAIKSAADWSKKWGIPLNCGEFGSLNTADYESRVRWTRAVRHELEANNISWTYWELNHGFGICAPDKPEIKKELAAALLQD
jgi:endoglucanase